MLTAFSLDGLKANQKRKSIGQANLRRRKIIMRNVQIYYIHHPHRRLSCPSEVPFSSNGTSDRKAEQG
jgi:hypothetical protein